MSVCFVISFGRVTRRPAGRAIGVLQWRAPVEPNVMALFWHRLVSQARRNSRVEQIASNGARRGLQHRMWPLSGGWAGKDCPYQIRREGEALFPHAEWYFHA